MRRLPLTVVLVLFAGCQFSASCGGKNLNVKKAEEFLSTTLEREVGTKPDSVTCPGPVKLEKDKESECTAKYGAATAKISLVQHNDEGGVTVKGVTGILIASSLERQISDKFGKKLNAHLTVECGERVRAAVVGESFTCVAKDAKGASGTIAVTVEDVSGKVRFELAPSAAPPPPEAPEPPATP